MRIWLKEMLYFDGLTDDLRERLIKSFKVPNPAYASMKRYSPHGTKYTSVPKFLFPYEEYADGTLGLPRAAAVPHGLFPEDIEVEDNRVSVPVTFPTEEAVMQSLKANGIKDFNEVQKKMAADFEKSCEEFVPTGYLIQVDTSGGKTIALLNLARLAGQKTLILTHRKLIFDVWLDDIGKMFDKDIAPVGIGAVRQKKCEIGEHFTLAMLQTLHRRDDTWVREFLANFGTVLIDEAHITPMPFIRSIIGNSPSLYRIGGTATPRRKDKMHQFLFWHLGEIAMKDMSTSSQNQLPISDARIVRTRFNYEPEDEEAFDAHELLEQLIADTARNRLVVNNVISDLSEGSRVLVATSRKKHVEYLARRFRKRGLDPIILTGERKDGQKAFDAAVAALQKGSKRLVIATEQLIREGANIPPLDRLHVAVPIADRKNFRQLCGRVRRVSPATGKREAKVTMYLDSRVPSMRRRVTHQMIPELQAMKVPNLNKMFIA